MYAKYVSNATSTNAQVNNDFALLLSGSPISALSASCDKVNSTLTSTVAPGWTLVDSAVPNGTTLGSVISAPDADALTTKFVYFTSTANNSAGLPMVQAAEAWNATAHTGTNLSGGTAALAYSNTSVNVFYIFATPRSFYITPINGQGLGSFEMTRDCAYLQGTTYPCFSVMAYSDLTGSNTTNAYMPRMKNTRAAGDLLTTSAKFVTATITSKFAVTASQASTPPSAALFDASNNNYFELRPIWAVSGTNIGSTILGKFLDVLETTYNAGATMDTLTVGTSTYALINTAPTAFLFKLA